MAVKQLTKELAQKLMEIKGEIRGSCLKTDWEFILQEKGKVALKKIEDKMAELGYPIRYKDIKITGFYPIGLDVISMLAIKEIFDFSREDFRKMGVASVKLSLFLKIIMSYFLSLDSLLKQVSGMWRKHFTIGNLEVSEINEEEKYIILRLKNFAVHPLYCTAFGGYFSKILEIAKKSSATCQETKCTFKGDKYHEFLVKWK